MGSADEEPLVVTINKHKRIKEVPNMAGAKVMASELGRPIIAGLVEEGEVHRVYPNGKTEFVSMYWSSADEAEREAQNGCHLFKNAEVENESEGRDGQSFVGCEECGTAHFVRVHELTEAQRVADLENLKRSLALSKQKPS
jgi:hypothetical protein